MENIKIFFAEDDDYTEYTSRENGSRNDIVVQIDEKLYHPSVYSLSALTQEFDEAIQKGKLYEIDNNIVLVENLSNEKIIEILVYLARMNYFQRVKEITLDSEFVGSFVLFPRLKTLDGWIRVY